MSRRDELAAVIAQGRCECWHEFGDHHIDTGCSGMDENFSACHCTNDMPTAEAGAVLAWLGEQLGDEGLLEALTEAIGRSHEAGRAKSELETFGAYDRRRAREDTSAALRQVREWFGVSE